MESRSLFVECLADMARAVLRGVFWGLGLVCVIALAWPSVAAAQEASEVAVATLAAASAAASSADASARSAAELVQIGGVLFWLFCTGLSFFGYSVGVRDV